MWMEASSFEPPSLICTFCYLAGRVVFAVLLTSTCVIDDYELLNFIALGIH